jgi:predicted RNA binding protein YcfA (HicA-like mRNA interferase family)
MQVYIKQLVYLIVFLEVRHGYTNFLKLGFVKVRLRGSHVILKKTVKGYSFGCVVPLRKSLKKGTLRGILRQANVSPENFDLAE